MTPTALSTAQERLWGLVCGLPEPGRSHRPLLMLKAYMDDSHVGDRSSAVYVVAGWVAPIKTWLAFSEDWDEVLRMSPRVQYFKWQEAMAFNGEFYGITEERRNEKLRLLIDIIS